MKKWVLLLFLVAAAGLTYAGCSGAFWAGSGAGVAGTGAGYEYRAHSEMNRIEDALEAGTMTQEEYNIRKDQIERMVLTK